MNTMRQHSKSMTSRWKPAAWKAPMSLVIIAAALGAAATPQRAHAQNEGRVQSGSSASKETWYRRANAVGIYHGNRLTLGALLGSVPDLAEDPGMGMGELDTGESRSALGLSVVFEGGWLGLPSQYGNFHGIEYQLGMRLNPNDIWGAVGFPVTFLNVGRGMPGSLRLGGSFGTGIGMTQAYLYVRGRAAMVIVPDLIDVEASVQWTPVATSAAWGSAPGDYEDLNLRGSVWYRIGRTKRAYEVYVEYFERDRRGFAALADGAPPRQNERDGEVKGFGIGAGISLF